MRTLAALLVLAAAVRADDWPRFRGPAGNGISAEKTAPLEWDASKNVLWRTPIAGTGNSSPIVSKGRVFVTVAEDQGRKRSLLCLDRKSGALLWTKTAALAEVEQTQKDNPYCGASPCADGERVIVWHSSAGLLCFDFEGKELWKADLGKFTHMWGYGASPVLHGDHVLLNCGPGARTFLVALDKKTGKEVWKSEEPGSEPDKWIGSWCTPLVATVDGKEQILVAYPSHVKGYDPSTGKVLWTVEGLGQLVYADVVLAGGIGVATGEDEAGDSIGFKVGGAKLWGRKRAMEVGTGLILDGHLWTVDNDGFIHCTEAATGKEVLKERSPGGAAWGSLIQAAGRVYYTSRSGDTVVFAPDSKRFKALAVNKLGEPTNATPAFSDGQVFLRTTKAVYCVGPK